MQKKTIKANTMKKSIKQKQEEAIVNLVKTVDRLRGEIKNLKSEAEKNAKLMEMKDNRIESLSSRNTDLVLQAKKYGSALECAVAKLQKKESERSKILTEKERLCIALQVISGNEHKPERYENLIEAQGETIYSVSRFLNEHGSERLTGLEKLASGGKKE